MVWTKSFCRACQAYCGIEVEVSNNLVSEVRGDRDHPMTGGYTCPKGRALPEQHNDPTRLRQSQKRTARGYEPIASEMAMDEIAGRFREIIDRHGPRSVALYLGTQGWHSSIYPVVRAWLAGIGSPGFYTSATIDQPGKQIAAIRHGTWAAGNQDFASADVFMMVGCNPLVSMWSATRFPVYNPSRRLQDAIANGLRLIVIDPRRSDVAKKAAIHLAVKPGEDPSLLAGMIRTILEEGLYDGDFCTAYVDGLEALHEAVADFTPEYVEERTGVPARDMLAAARMFAAGRSGMATSGTGPSMAPRGNLSEQLILSLNTICGRYPRAGDVIPNPGTLGPAIPRYAEPVPGRRVEFSVESVIAGVGALARPGPPEMPTTTLADQILTPGPSQVRALVVVGGNPIVAFPDQQKTLNAFAALELSVSIDVAMSATARRCQYVIAPTLPFERADCTAFFDSWYPRPFAQYTPALVTPQSDVISEAEFFWGLARRLGVAISLPGGDLPLDRRPSGDDILDLVVTGSRIPLDEVRRHPGGAVFEPEEVHRVEPRRPGTQGRLVAGEPELIAELREVRAESTSAGGEDPFPFRLVSRRLREVSNSSLRTLPSIAARIGGHNPAFMHPQDLEELDLARGDSVTIRSRHGEIPAIVAADPDLTPGVISMSHCFGDGPEADSAYREIGSPTNRLVGFDERTDAYTRMPVQSAIPVAVVVLSTRR